MDGDFYQPQIKESGLKLRIINFLEEIWPSIYRNINDAVDGIFAFIKDLIETPFRRFR